MVHAVHRTLQAFLLNVSFNTAEEIFDTVLDCQPDYNMLARQFIDVNSASDRAELIQGCSSTLQFMMRYPDFNRTLMNRMQQQRAHHPARPPPRRAPQKAQGILPGAVAPAPRPAARPGGAKGQARGSLDPSGSGVPGQASGSRSWVPVSAAGAASTRGGLDPSGSVLPGQASAAKSSAVPVGPPVPGAAWTPRGPASQVRPHRAKYSKASAPPAAAPKPKPSSA